MNFYTHGIKKISHDLKAFNIKPYFLYDGSKNNFLMAQKVKNCLLELQQKGFKIPKFTLRFDQWDELEPGNIAETYTEIMHRASEIVTVFKSPTYKHIDKNDNLFRLKTNPSYTSFEADYYHEFSHEYLQYFKPELFDKYCNVKFPEDSSREILKELGGYATADKSEFIAECFSKIMLNQPIQSKEVKSLYEATKWL